MKNFYENKTKKSWPLGLKIFTLLLLPALMLVMCMGVVAQTLSFNPAPSSGVITICEGGQVIVTINDAVPTNEYQLYLQPDNILLETITATTTTVVFSPVTITTVGNSKFLQVIRSVPPFAILGSVQLNVVDDPIAPTLTHSPAQGVICPGTSVSATLSSAGSGGVGGCVDNYQYRINGGEWQTYVPGDLISDNNENFTIDIRAFREHPDGLGCFAENIYSWTYDTSSEPNFRQILLYHTGSH